MIEWLMELLFGPVIESPRTIDGGKLCPYPGMTDADLADFEKWADSL